MAGARERLRPGEQLAHPIPRLEVRPALSVNELAILPCTDPEPPCDQSDRETVRQAIVLEHLRKCRASHGKERTATYGPTALG
jgi:hypothetical protein